MSKKIAMLFPYAPSYREPIYQLMDKKLDIDWYFCGDAERNLKMFDYKLLNHCNLTMEEKKILGPIVYYKGITDLNLQQYDAIICAGVIRCLSEWWLLQKWGKNMKRPQVFLWTHGWYGKETKIQRILLKFFYRKVDGFFLYGDYAKKLMLKENFDSRKLHVIKNSLDYDKQLVLRRQILPSNVYKDYFKNDNPVIVFIGRLTQVKQLNMLVDAVAKLKEKGEYYNISFVGDGVERESLQQQVNMLGIAEKVWFYGACYDEKTNAELIYNADLCVAPGNIGLTAMHVLMFGCPAISHNDFKWQMPEFEAIKPGQTGDFFEKGDVDSLAYTINRWFAEKKDKREEVRKACYQEIDENWNPHYQINILKQVLEL